MNNYFVVHSDVQSLTGLSSFRAILLLFHCYAFNSTLLSKTKGTSGSSLEKNVVNLAETNISWHILS